MQEKQGEEWSKELKIEINMYKRRREDYVGHRIGYKR